MPAKTWDQWVQFGLISAPGADGRWDEEVLTRVRVAQSLADRARALPRRALHLQREGHWVEPEARQRAVVEVLRRVRPAARKMRQVRQEVDSMARRIALRPQTRRPRSFGIGLRRESWIDVVQGASVEEFDQAYAIAARLADAQPEAPETRKGRAISIPFDERASLLVVNLLLGQPTTRKRMSLPPIPSEAPAIKP
jgi:hypothetical protein